MRALTLFRAMAWFGVAVVFWSLNVRWGTDIDVRVGPPGPWWQRVVVGCGLLGFVAALALSVSGRKGASPAWWARGVAGGASLLMLFLAWRVYGRATGLHADTIQGTGFTWMVAGSGMVMSAVIGTLGMKPPATDKKDPGKGKRRKR